MRKEHREHRWYRPLFNIVWMALIDVAALITGIIIDVYVIPDPELGHKAPAATLIIFLVFGFISIIVVLCSVISAVHRYWEHRNPEAMRKPINYLWLIPLQLIIDVVAIYGSFQMDQGNYTPLPTGSFMFPLVTMMAMAIFGMITLIVIVIATALTIHSKKKFRKLEE